MSNSAPRFEALSFGAILDQTFRFYIKDFLALVGFSVLCNLPILAITVVMMFLSPQEQLVLNLAIIPISVVTSSLLTGGLTMIVSQRYLGQPISMGRAASLTFKLLGRLIWAEVLVFLWLVLGIFLLLVPYFIWMFTLSLVVPVVALEGVGGSRALARSKELVRFDVWKVVGIVLTVGCLLAGVMMGSVFGLALISYATGSLSETSALLNIGPSVIGYLLAPLSSISMVLLYYDLRIRKEGFDLEMLSREMATA